MPSDNRDIPPIPMPPGDDSETKPYEPSTPYGPPSATSPSEQPTTPPTEPPTQAPTQAPTAPPAAPTPPPEPLPAPGGAQGTYAAQNVYGTQPPYQGQAQYQGQPPYQGQNQFQAQDPSQNAYQQQNPYQQPNPYQAPNPYLATNPYGQPYPERASSPNGLAIASMVCGIAGIFLSLALFGLFPAIAAVITGHMAQRRQPAAKPFWLTGLITGYVGIALAILTLLLFILPFIFLIGTADYYGTGGLPA